MMPEESDSINSPSPGERLKAKRIEYGISLQEVSSALLLSVTYLKALEDNHYEELPGLTYIVGYWRSYASLLGIDISEDIRIHKIRLEATEANPAFDYNHGDFHQGKSRKGSVILFLLLITGFLGGLWYWQNPANNPTFPINKIQFGTELNIPNNENNAVDDVIDNSILLPLEPKTIDQPELFEDADEPNAPGVDADAGAEAEADVEEPTAPDAGADTVAGADAEEPTAPDVDVDADAGVDVQPEPGVSEDQVSGLSDQPDPLVDADSITGVDVDVDAENPRFTSTHSDEPEPDQDSGLDNESDAGSDDEEFGTDPRSRYDANSLRWIKVDVHKTVWIDIRNGQGEKLVFRTVNEGEILRLNSSPPFYVFIGSLDGVEVFYLGESVEIPPHSSGQSSRFVVGEYPEATSN